MGKITVNGYAEREVAYDQMRINIEFFAIEKSSSRAVEEVMKQSDEFIDCLIKKGISKEFIHFNEDSLGKDYRYQENHNHNAERCIYIDIEFNMVLLNTIVDLVEKFPGDISYNVKYSLSNVNTIHEELVKEAFQDAKHKAELIISSYGREINGIKSIKTNKGSLLDRFEHCFKLEDGSGYCGTSHISNDLQSPTTIEREVVEVVWLF